MKLTMKAIIRWELLCKKPFSKLDYDNEDDIISLFYVCSQPNIIESSLSEFKNDLKEDDLKRMIGDFERLTSLSAQFTAEPKKRPKTKETDPNEIKEPEPAYIKEIVPMLVMNGLDADFALNEMELYDLPLFTQAYDQKIKDALTAQRFWAYIQVSPHLQEGSTPESLCPFKWEIDEKEGQILQQAEEGTSIFKAFMNSNSKKTE